MTETEYPPLEDVWLDRQTILDQVWSHLNELTCNPDTRLYFYSALELRLLIEALFTELLVHLKNGQLTKRDLKIYKPDEFARVLRNVEPEFLSLASSELGFIITENDLNKIFELYGRLGNYLHLPKEPFFHHDQEQWKQDFEQLVIEGYGYLKKLSGCE